jgi:SAM-dependent methyltransferase
MTVGQGEHYDQILDDYEHHYYDDASMAYRRRFIYSTMFKGLDLNGKRVAELACGSGYNSVELLRLFPEADIFGLDISPKSVEAYRRQVGKPCFVCDLTAPVADFPPAADVAFVVGGLHHCVNDLPTTFKNLKRLVRPGGSLIMVEPNAAFLLNAVRKLWYAEDKWFREQEEAPLYHNEISRMASGTFESDVVTFLGGPAYFLILNSLILRVPHALKKVIAKPLFLFDELYNRLPGSAPFPMFIARWHRPAESLQAAA